MGCGTSHPYWSTVHDILPASEVAEPAATNDRHFHEEYVLSRKLGSGNFGSVYAASSVATSRTFAVKVLDLRRKGMVGYEENKFDSERRELAIREAAIVQRLPAGRNIVSCVDFFLEGGLSYMVMELAECALPQFLADKGDTSAPFLRQVFHDMLKGVAAVHEADVVHRDVKPDNFVVSMGGSAADFSVLICDFSLARGVGSAYKPQLVGTVGTLPYMAPEILNGDTYCGKVDVWALGVTLYRILCGRLPFTPAAQTPKAMLAEISATIHSPSSAPAMPASRAASRLLRSIFCVVPRRRPAARSLLSNPFIEDDEPLADPPLAPPPRTSSKRSSRGSQDFVTDVDVHLRELQAVARAKGVWSGGACPSELSTDDDLSMGAGFLRSSS